MTNLIRINDEIISSDSFVKLLKLSGRFDTLIDDIVQEKLAVHAAKKHRRQAHARVGAAAVGSDCAA